VSNDIFIGHVIYSIFGIGFFVILLFWPFTKFWSSNLIIKISLGVGVGQGITACSFFLWLIVFGSPDRRLIIVEATILVILITVLAYRMKKRGLLSEAKRDFMMALKEHL
jgi:hypothetical protein